MEENKEEQAQPQKFTYEQLENIAANLSSQVQQLSMKLQEANMVNVFKRIDYLFKVVENVAIFPGEFAENCVKEIQSLMTLPEEPAKEE